MKILNDSQILDFLDSENKSKPEFSVKSLQIQLDYFCGCKITQDKRGNWLFPCKKHFEKACQFRNDGFIHRYC